MKMDHFNNNNIYIHFGEEELSKINETCLEYI
jgi:hypothetical protein